MPSHARPITAIRWSSAHLVQEGPLFATFFPAALTIGLGLGGVKPVAEPEFEWAV